MIRTVQGFEVYVLANESLELSLVPALGAKIISLINRQTGREWMWHPPGSLKLFRNQLGDDFATGPITGWDECLPTVLPCINKGRALPDHGEVWSVPWELNPGEWQRQKLKTTVRLAVSPFDFERIIELSGNRIHVRYQLTNRNSEPEKFLWAMHPLIPVFAGDRLELAAAARRQLAGESWVESLDFAAGQPACAKVFAGPLGEGRAGISNASTGDRMTFFWDPQANPALGLWLSRGGWHGYHQLALEPTNGAANALDQAGLEGRCGVVPPGSTVSWAITIQIDPGKPCKPGSQRPNFLKD